MNTSPQIALSQRISGNKPFVFIGVDFERDNKKHLKIQSATYLLKHAVDFRYILEWMGHETIQTTEQFKCIVQTNKNFKNPFDDVEI